MSDYPPGVVYIVGSGRSGSTLLDMVLGAHPLLFSLGEIADLPRYWKENRICACRRPVLECPLWSEVFRELAARHGVVRGNLLGGLTDQGQMRRFQSRIVYLSQMFSRLMLPGVQFNAGTGSGHSINYFLDLYHIVRKKAGVPLLVDSSKTIRRALRISWLDNENKSYFIHLVRDGRGVLNSMKKQEFIIEEPILGERGIEYVEKTQQAVHTSRSTLHYIYTWMKINLVTAGSLLTVPRERRMLLRYEDLANDPELSLKEVCNFLSIDFSDSMLHFRKIEHHNIDGNPVRFRSEGIRAPDQRWKTGLPPLERFLFRLSAGWLNRSFGYQ